MKSELSASVLKALFKVLRQRELAHEDIEHRPEDPDTHRSVSD